ncbi:hypothetical protein PFLUV_G00146790 [Perca fluviatilis]|uniref:Uncharacterized protein n=1 Tax=Perca fluviatilis TaxID=8168 RepID=A0A6A5EWJ0_PERFL|nr:uncharacterized protein LOC120570339 [Perca fluviatilis]KAF1382729.1 hypothetical protein PFLUV_G00146790 [Perca fluviatilis]
MEENTMASNNNKKEILVLSALGLLLVEEEICRRRNLRRNGTKSWISQRQPQGASPRQITEKINISEKETKKKSLQSQLTRYRKLSPSGSSGTDKTARQQRILRMLEFLKPHTKSNLTHTEPPAPTDTISGATVDALDNNQDETAFEPLIAESTFLDPGFESTSSSSSAGSPRRPPAKRSRKSHDDSLADTKMRTIEAALHRMSAEGRPDFIAVACQSIEHKFRMVPPHLLPRLENRVQNLIFNFFEEHNLDTHTHDS